MYLGIDIGTSGVKAVILGSTGAVLAQASAPLTVSRPQQLWSEQDPDSWCAATEAAVLALPADLRSGVAAIGLEGVRRAEVVHLPRAVARPAQLDGDLGCRHVAEGQRPARA